MEVIIFFRFYSLLVDHARISHVFLHTWKDVAIILSRPKIEKSSKNKEKHIIVFGRLDIDHMLE
jgi:hypothetical protein